MRHDLHAIHNLLRSVTRSQDLPVDSQHSPLLIGKQDALLIECVHQDSDLCVLEFNDLLLLTVDQAGYDEKENLPWRENEFQGGMVPFSGE